MGANQFLAGQLVEPLGQALAQPAAVREDDRAGVAPDQLEDRRVDRRPDARSQVRADGRATGLLLLGQDVTDGAHVVDRDDDLELERLAGAGVDDRDLAIRPDAAHESGDRVEGALGGAEADALRGFRALLAQRLQAFQAQGEVSTPFRAGDRVDLVDDDVLDAAQDLAGLAREEEVQALGGRDEDVGRAARDLAAVLGRGVAGPAGDGDPGRWFAQVLGRVADAGERRPQVAFHVVGQGLERGDVEDADVAWLAPLWRRARVLGEAVDGVEEGGQGLAAPRRRVDERVLATRDRGPALPPGPGWAPRSSPRTTPGRRARTVRADRRRSCWPRTLEYRRTQPIWTGRSISAASQLPRAPRGASVSPAPTVGSQPSISARTRDRLHRGFRGDRWLRSHRFAERPSPALARISDPIMAPSHRSEPIKLLEARMASAHRLGRKRWLPSIRHLRRRIDSGQ